MHIRAINVAICWKEFNLRIRRFRIISCWTLRYNLSEKPKFLYLTIPLTAEVKTFVLRIFLIQLGKCPSVVHLHREEIKRLDSAKAYFGFRFWKKNKSIYTQFKVPAVRGLTDSFLIRLHRKTIIQDVAPMVSPMQQMKTAW